MKRYMYIVLLLFAVLLAGCGQSFDFESSKYNVEAEEPEVTIEEDNQLINDSNYTGSSGSNYNAVPGKGNIYEENGKRVYWTLLADSEAENLQNNNLTSRNGRQALDLRQFEYRGEKFWSAQWEYQE